MDIESFAIGLMVSAKNGGGSQPTASPWTKLAEQDFTVSTSSTSETTVGTIDCGDAAVTGAKMVYVRVRDKAGKRAGYFFGTDIFFIQRTGAEKSLNYDGCMLECKYTTGNVLSVTNQPKRGVFVSGISSSGVATVKSRYDSTYSLTIDGTYHVEVYTLEWPDNVSPFA